MASESNPVTGSTIQGDGEGGDPLTPIERLILDMLLKKKASAESKTELQPSTSDVQKIETKINDRSAPSAAPLPKSSQVKSERDGDMSEGPLDEEQLEALMREYGLSDVDELDESDESYLEPLEEKSDSEIADEKPVARGRGRGRGSRSNRGKARSTPAPFINDDSGESEMSEENANDPAERGSEILEHMSDDQILQWMNKFKEEPEAGGSFDTDAFLAWLPTKMAPIVPATEGKKFSVSPTTLRGGRGRARGGGRGSRGGRGARSRRAAKEEN